MSRYYFDVHDGFSVSDEIGRELSGLGEAKSEAMRVASGFAANPNIVSENGGTMVITVRNKSNHVVATVRLVFSIETA